MRIETSSKMYSFKVSFLMKPKRMKKKNNGAEKYYKKRNMVYIKGETW